MPSKRRICFNFEEIFDDHRKLCFLFIDREKFKTVKDFVSHIQLSFNINEPVYLTENNLLLPDFEDIRLLIYATHTVKVKRCTNFLKDYSEKTAIEEACHINNEKNDRSISKMNYHNGYNHIAVDNEDQDSNEFYRKMKIEMMKTKLKNVDLDHLSVEKEESNLYLTQVHGEVLCDNKNDFITVTRKKKKKKIKNCDKIDLENNDVTDVNMNTSLLRYVYYNNRGNEESVKKAINLNENENTAAKIENMGSPNNKNNHNIIAENYNLETRNSKFNNNNKSDLKINEHFVNKDVENCINGDADDDNIKENASHCCLDDNDLVDVQGKQSKRKRKRTRRRKKNNPIENDTILSYENNDVTKYKNETSEKTKHIRFKSDDDDTHDGKMCNDSETELLRSSNFNKNIKNMQNGKMETNLHSQSFNYCDIYANDNCGKNNADVETTVQESSTAYNCTRTNNLSRNKGLVAKENGNSCSSVSCDNNMIIENEYELYLKSVTAWSSELMKMKEIHRSNKLFKPPVFNRTPKPKAISVAADGVVSDSSPVMNGTTATKKPDYNCEKVNNIQATVDASITGGLNTDENSNSNHSLNVDDIVNFKILFLGDNYTPKISEPVIGRVISVSEEKIQLKIFVGKDICKPSKGRFSLDNYEEKEDEDYEDGEENNDKDKDDDIVELHLKDLINPKKIISPFNE